MDVINNQLYEQLTNIWAIDLDELVKNAKKSDSTPSLFVGRKGKMAPVDHYLINGLVINKTFASHELKERNKVVLTLNHDNIERILYHNTTKDYNFVWITPLYVTKLKTVWKNVEQSRYGVKKMFHDLLNGLEYMKSKNIATGVIHEDNLAYNGYCWYISGIVNALKLGEGASGEYTTSCLKSRRCLIYNNFVREYIPEDDLWQLLLMYVITYYGFNPFQEQGTHFLPDYGTLKNNTSRQNEYLSRIMKGKCQDITLSTTTDCFGRILKNLLTCSYLSNDSYKLFRYIIENNGMSTYNTEELYNLVLEDLKSAIQKKEKFEIEKFERDKNNELERNKINKSYPEREAIYELQKELSIINAETTDSLVIQERKSVLYNRYNEKCKKIEEDTKRLETEMLEKERILRENLQREKLEREREIIEIAKILTDPNSPLSLNVDQYIEKFKQCECIVCFSNTIYYKFSPCNHEICCHSCYTRLDPKNCPMCRQSINSTEKLTTERISALNIERQTLYVNITSF